MVSHGCQHLLLNSRSYIQNKMVVAAAPWHLPSDHLGACTGSVHHSPHCWCCHSYETSRVCDAGVVSDEPLVKRPNLGKRVAFTTIILKHLSASWVASFAGGIPSNSPPGLPKGCCTHGVGHPMRTYANPQRGYDNCCDNRPPRTTRMLDRIST